MLKLFTNTDFLVEKHRREIFPLLFDLVFKKNETLLASYQIVDSIEVADIVVCPINYESIFKHHRIALSTLLKLSRKHKKPFWMLTAGDYGFTPYIANSYVFRSGGFNSVLNKNTFILPAFINDPYKEFLECDFSILKKTKQPTIGFVGHAKSGIVKFIKEYYNHIKYRFKSALRLILADKQKFYPSSVKRAKYLNKLTLHQELNTHFIFRNNYRAGANSPVEQQKTALQFYNNIFENAYTFCLRGVGNFSVRFYETLAMGRIPIVVNTDCRFPLEDKIDWNKHCLIIDEKAPKPLAEYILEFHNNLSISEFEALQQSNRNLWLHVLQREAYFLEVYNHFKNKLQ